MGSNGQPCADPIPLAEAARRLGRSPSTLKRWVQLGRLTVYRDEFTTIRWVSAAAVDALKPRSRGE